ncbi:MAG: hypothetical protein AAFN81_15820 [Bacteroidota bacterium]
MGYVASAYRDAGTEIFIIAGKKRLAATVTRPPFLKI